MGQQMRTIVELPEQQIKALKKTTDQTPEILSELETLQKKYYEMADEVLLYSDHEDQKKLYGENNARNRCVYNRSKSIGMLDELNDDTYDKIHERVYNNPEVGKNIMDSMVKAKTILRKKKKD